MHILALVRGFFVMTFFERYQHWTPGLQAKKRFDEESAAPPPDDEPLTLPGAAPWAAPGAAGSDRGPRLQRTAPVVRWKCHPAEALDFCEPDAASYQEDAGCEQKACLTRNMVRTYAARLSLWLGLGEARRRAYSQLPELLMKGPKMRMTGATQHVWRCNGGDIPSLYDFKNEQLSGALHQGALLMAESPLLCIAIRVDLDSCKHSRMPFNPTS